MSRTGPSLPAAGPQLADVARLWAYLTTEWVTDLVIRLEPGHNSDGTPFLELSLQSWRHKDEEPQGYLYTWAKRRFSGVDYKGSYNQLYDLLIVGLRAIEKEFGVPEGRS